MGLIGVVAAMVLHSGLNSLFLSYHLSDSPSNISSVLLLSKYASGQKKMSQKHQLSSLSIAELCVSQGTLDLKKSDFIKVYPIKSIFTFSG